MTDSSRETHVAKRVYAHGLAGFDALARLLSQRYVSVGIIVLATVAFSIRLLVLIHRHSVNVLYWDQWDFWKPLFEDGSLWSGFHLQHGPHRQGLGHLVIVAVAEISDWDTRAECFVIGIILVLAALMALLLKRKLAGSWSWSDAAIPLIILTPTQYEVWVGTPNPAHGALPILLLFCFCLTLLIERRVLRYTLMLVLNFLLIHTGFGLFAGLLTPVVIGLDIFFSIREKERDGIIAGSVALIIAVASMGIFFIEYRFRPAAAGFQFPHPEWWLYLEMVALAYARVVGSVGMEPSSIRAGALVLILFLFCGYRFVFHLLERDSERRLPALVIFVLVSFSLLFVANMAIGRLSLGTGSAQSSRYVPLLLPALVGVYLFAALFLAGRIQQLALIAVVVLASIIGGPAYRHDTIYMRQISKSKRSWAQAYLRTESVEAADDVDGFPIYPAPRATGLSEKLGFLKQNELNLYK